MGRFFTESPQCLDAIHSGKPDIKEDEIVGVLFDPFQAIFTCRDAFGRETFVFEDAF